MRKKEFLDTLRMQLQGEMTPGEIEGHIRYYDEYITDAVLNGKSEEQVIEELGSPVFIAKTLMDTAEAEEKEECDERYGQAYGASDEQEDAYSGRMHTFHVSPFVLRWVIPIVLVLLLFLILSLLGTVVAFAARFIVPILLVVLVISIFKKKQ